MSTPSSSPSRPAPQVATHMRGPFIAGKMQMTAKDWALLRDRDGNSIVQHRLGDVVAVVFGENDQMEAERLRLMAAAPAMRDALQAMVDLFNEDDNAFEADWHGCNAPLAAARSALALAHGAAPAGGANPEEKL